MAGWWSTCAARCGTSCDSTCAPGPQCRRPPEAASSSRGERGPVSEPPEPPAALSADGAGGRHRCRPAAASWRHHTSRRSWVQQDRAGRDSHGRGLARRQRLRHVLQLRSLDAQRLLNARDDDRGIFLNRKRMFFLELCYFNLHLVLRLKKNTNLSVVRTSSHYGLLQILLYPPENASPILSPLAGPS